jgi:mRNA interferase MazF
VISPDEMNRNIRTVIIAPMTSTQKEYPTRVSCTFQKKKGQIVLEQLSTIDKARLIKKLGTIGSKDQLEVVISILRDYSPFNINTGPTNLVRTLTHHTAQPLI